MLKAALLEAGIFSTWGLYPDDETSDTLVTDKWTCELEIEEIYATISARDVQDMELSDFPDWIESIGLKDIVHCGEIRNF